MKISKIFSTRILKVAFCLVFLANGCAVVSNISGNYMSRLERTKDYAKVEVFDYPLDECFNKVLAFVRKKEAGMEVLKINRRKYSMLLWVSRPMPEDVDGTFPVNTADVAVFFKAEGPDKTTVQINSLSSLFVEYSADKIFAELNPPAIPTKEETGETKK
jgi:hypothetical protein